MIRKRLAFLANSFHLGKTKSSQFFVDLLSRHYDVTVIPHKEAWLRVNRKRFDVLVSWQHLYPARELAAFGIPQTILVPMYDDSPKDPEFWKQYGGVTVISFCKALSAILAKSGVTYYSCQYYPEMPEGNSSQMNSIEGLRCFFWQRTPVLSWENTIKPLLGAIRPEKFYLHAAADPGFSIALPSDEDLRRYNINVSVWFDRPQEIRQVLDSANVYFAPRSSEGIGMSFIEALTLGKCVVAPDSPTMNEYIAHGKNGILYNLKKPEISADLLDPDTVARIGRAAHETAIVGRNAWLSQENDLLQSIENACADRRLHRFRFFGFWSWALFKNCFRILKRIVKQK